MSVSGSIDVSACISANSAFSLKPAGIYRQSGIALKEYGRSHVDIPLSITKHVK
jgi:hypothetical protein